MKIGELSKRSGIPASALRYYEKLKLLPSPPRIAGARRYSKEDLHRVQLVNLAKAAGFSLLEIKQLLNGFPMLEPPRNRWRVLVRQKRLKLEEQQQRIVKMLKLLSFLEQCECTDMEECAKRYIEKS